MDCTRPPANGHGVHLVGGVQHRRSNSYGVRRQSAQQGDPLVDMWVTVITVWWVCCALFWAALGAVAVELKVCVRVGEYLVNIAQPAQKRVTGGRWRRIVLGHVLAEHVLELRGRARLWGVRALSIMLPLRDGPH